MKTLAFPVMMSLLLGGCTFNFWNKDFVTPSEKLQPPAFHMLTLGMSKHEVTTALGVPDQVIGARRDGNSVIERWEYFRIAAVADRGALPSDVHRWKAQLLRCLWRLQAAGEPPLIRGRILPEAEHSLIVEKRPRQRASSVST